ncbi:MAG: DNA alkylation repair protein [Saprospiraceae bacterium]|nr:DNA alkylation repair protein [Saprospiraceae bacterium]
MAFFMAAPYEQLLAHFQAHADEDQAGPMAKYMRNQFSFLGIKSPLRKELSKSYLKKYGRPEGEALQQFCRACFASPFREMQYFVGDMMIPIAKKVDSSFMPLYVKLVLTKSWWDTIDFIAPRLMGGILLREPELIELYPKQWIRSDNIWLQRCAILFQLHFREKTDADLLFEFILSRKDSDEFFVQKAAGWALRQFSKLNAKAVMDFVAQHDLPALTEREGLKWLQKNGYSR